MTTNKKTMTGVQLRDRRRRADLTQSELAALFGCHYSTIWLYEKERQKIPSRAVIALDLILGRKEQEKRSS